MKPKAQTLQQKLGFFDDDLKNPKHDDIMLWLDKNIENIVNELFNKPYSDKEISTIVSIEQAKIDTIIKKIINNGNLSKNSNSTFSLQDALKRNSSDEGINATNQMKNVDLEILKNFNIQGSIPPKPRITQITKKWEHPIIATSGNFKNTIGFIDFMASFRVPKLKLNGMLSSQITPTQTEFYGINKEYFGFDFEPIEKTIFIEVKTVINSLGELLRQINQYKTYTPYTDFYVLAPDDTHKDVLKEQGIGFIKFH